MAVPYKFLDDRLRHPVFVWTESIYGIGHGRQPQSALHLFGILLLFTLLTAMGIGSKFGSEFQSYYPAIVCLYPDYSVLFIG